MAPLATLPTADMLPGLGGPEKPACPNGIWRGAPWKGAPPLKGMPPPFCKRKRL